MTTKPMTLREICDAAALFEIQSRPLFSKSVIGTEGSILQVEFSNRREKSKRGLLYETETIGFDCGSADKARQWEAALNGGEKLSVSDFVAPKHIADIEPLVADDAQAARIIRVADAPKSPQQLLLDAKLVFNNVTRQKDTVRLRYSTGKDGVIPYETIPYPTVNEARKAQQEYAKTAQINVGIMACSAS